MGLNEFRQDRRQLAQRTRRMIMNNDGGDVLHWYSPLQRDDAGPAPDSPEAFWARRCTGMEDSQIDSVFYCTGGNFDQHCHDSKLAEFLTADHDPYPYRNYSQSYIDQGRDCLQLIIDFCREHGREVFWSLRLNDTHDNWFPAMYPEYKKQHPDHLLFRPEDIGKPAVGRMEPHMNATAVDFGRQEVRDHQFDIMEEVCQRYDVDGVEMDFMRQPIYFRPTLEGRPVEPEHIEIMNGFVRRVRAMTEELGMKRGRPILAACRVPNTIRCSCEIGLDLETWLAEDLIDLLVSSLEHDPFTGPAAELTELGHRYQTPVYANVGESRDTHWIGIGELEGWAAAATNAWNAGVDGLYTFNRFDPHSEVFRTAGDPSLLEMMDKVYAIDDVGERPRTWAHTLPLEGRLPLELAPGSCRSAVLRVGDDVAARAAEGVLGELSLRIYIDRFTYTDEAEFRLNGKLLDAEVLVTSDGVSPVACGLFLLRARPEAACIKKGDNTFEALLKSRCESAPGLPSVTAVQLVIRYEV